MSEAEGLRSWPTFRSGANSPVGKHLNYVRFTSICGYVLSLEGHPCSVGELRSEASVISEMRRNSPASGHAGDAAHFHEHEQPGSSESDHSSFRRKGDWGANQLVLTVERALALTREPLKTERALATRLRAKVHHMDEYKRLLATTTDLLAARRMTRLRRASRASNWYDRIEPIS